MPGENPAEDFLDEEFPLRLRPLLPSAMRRAYAAAGRVVETISFLSTPAGKLQRGDLIALAAEYEIERLAKAGALPFEPTWEPYARPTGLHLVLRTARAKLTVSQVEDGKRKPRHASFRENYGLANKLYLFEFMNEEMRAAKDPRHLLLLHGYQSLDFVYLAVPHAERKRHLARSANLMLVPHTVASEAPEEGPRDIPDLEAIDQLLRTVQIQGIPMTNVVTLPERWIGFVPERLVQARVAREMSRRELAELLEISGQAVAYYEVGERRPDMRMILKFSQNLGRFPNFFLTANATAGLTLETRFFRSVGKRTNRINDALDVRAKWLWEIVSFIADRVRLPQVNLPQPSAPATRDYYLPAEIEDIAQQTRRHWGLGDGPIANMVALLETFGAVTTRFSLGSARIDAFSYWVSGRPYIVLGSDKKSAARSRFDAAHELGHLILHRDISQEELAKKFTLDRIEAEANKFAGAFLLPRDSLLSEFYSTRINHLEGLKKRWRVSMQAIAHRAKDIGAIDEYQYINFRKQISAQKMLVVEPLDDVLPIEQPKLLMKAWTMLAEGGELRRLAETTLGLGPDLVEEVCGVSLTPPPPPPEPVLRRA